VGLLHDLQLNAATAEKLGRAEKESCIADDFNARFQVVLGSAKSRHSDCPNNERKWAFDPTGRVARFIPT
jgi:hypothetical protein